MNRKYSKWKNFKEGAMPRPEIIEGDIPIDYMTFLFFLRDKMMDHYGEDWYKQWVKFHSVVQGRDIGLVENYFKVIR